MHIKTNTKNKENIFNLTVQHLENTVVQYNSWHTGAGRHVCIFESLQLEGSYVGDLTVLHFRSISKLYCLSPQNSLKISHFLLTPVMALQSNPRHQPFPEMFASYAFLPLCLP